MVLLHAPFAAHQVCEETRVVPIVDADRRGVIGHFLARRALELSRQVLYLPPCPDERVRTEQPELDGVVERVDAGDACFDPAAVRLYFFLMPFGFLALATFFAFLRIVA